MNNVLFKRCNRGFSIIELMIVIAIIGILIAMAIPAYTDYIVRSKITDMLSASGGMKQSLYEYRAVKGSFATAGGSIDFDTVGVNDPSSLSDAINETHLYTTDGSTTVVIGMCGDSSNLGLTGTDYVNLYLVGTWLDNGIKWSCQYTGIGKYVPTSCREEYTLGGITCNN